MEKDENGYVTVTAICPEGEEMTVSVQKQEMTIPKATVYIVTQRDFETANDDIKHVGENKKSRMEITGVYGSRKAANTAAEDCLSDASKNGQSKEYEKEILSNGLFYGYALFRDEERRGVEVKVEEWDVRGKLQEESEDSDDDDQSDDAEEEEDDDGC